MNNNQFLDGRDKEFCYAPPSSPASSLQVDHTQNHYKTKFKLVPRRVITLQNSNNTEDTRDTACKGATSSST